MISIRAVPAAMRISDEIDVSVLKRKCGLIWFASASIFAASSSFSCSCSRCSMRALFQILIGVATASTVASRTSDQSSTSGVGREVEQPVVAEPRAERLAEQLERDRREQQHDLPVDLQRRGASARRAVAGSVKTNGEKCQIASFGHSFAQAAAGEPAADGEGQRDELAGEERRAGRPAAPTMAPAYGPAIRPARNAPSSVRSAAL